MTTPCQGAQKGLLVEFAVPAITGQEFIFDNGCSCAHDFSELLILERTWQASIPSQKRRPWDGFVEASRTDAG